MSLQPQIELLDKMGNLGESIPGLDVGPIVDNLAKKSEELKTITESIDTEEDEEVERGMSRNDAKKKADAQKKKIVDTYKKNIKETVKEKITVIKQNYKVFKDSVESIPADVTALITNIALPPAITAPPGGPNPIYALNIAKQGKNTLGRTLNNAIVAFTEVLKAANAIKFEIPKFILDLFEKISFANSVISGIPI